MFWFWCCLKYTFTCTCRSTNNIMSQQLCVFYFQLNCAQANNSFNPNYNAIYGNIISSFYFICLRRSHKKTCWFIVNYLTNAVCWLNCHNARETTSEDMKNIDCYPTQHAPTKMHESVYNFRISFFFCGPFYVNSFSVTFLKKTLKCIYDLAHSSTLAWHR